MRLNRHPFFILLIGAIVGCALTFFGLNSQISKLSNQVDSLRTGGIIGNAMVDSSQLLKKPANKILFRETFDSNINNWTAKITETSTRLVYGGKFIFEYGEDNFFTWATVSLPDSIPTDYDVELIADHKKGSEDSEYGLFFCTDENNFVRYCITKSGYVSVNIKTNGEYLPRPFPITAGFDNEDGMQDVWIVKVRGDMVQYYINGTLAYEGAKGLNWNYVGVFVEDKQTVEFDELTIVEGK
ncbi:MAG: hypothetical protein R3E32_02235 [Chitinophagales bacterium]